MCCQDQILTWQPCLFPKKWFNWQIRSIYTGFCSSSFAYNYIIFLYGTQFHIRLWHLKKKCFREKFKCMFVRFTSHIILNINCFSGMSSSLSSGDRLSIKISSSQSLASVDFRDLVWLSVLCGWSTGLRLERTMFSLWNCHRLHVTWSYFCSLWTAGQVYLQYSLLAGHLKQEDWQVPFSSQTYVLCGAQVGKIKKRG